MTEQIVTYHGTVYTGQCDHMGHMNAMWYAGQFDEATRQLLSACGLTPSRFRAEGLAMAAVEGLVAYKGELRAGDPISIRSEVMKISDKSVRIVHEMTHGATGEVVASMILVGVHIDVELRKACALPADVRARMSGDESLSARTGGNVLGRTSAMHVRG